MRYRVSELAQHAGVSVDTIRFYQGQHLIDPPERDGRIVWYDEAHLERMQHINRLAGAGFTLAQISRLFADDPDPLLEVLSDRDRSETVSLRELAVETGIEPRVLTLSSELGLLHADGAGSGLRFDATQVEMVHTVARLVDSGVDVDALVRLAIQHATATEEVVAQAVDLYRDAVLVGGDPDRATVAAEIELLVPAVTRLVAEHFSQTLVSRAAVVLAGLDKANTNEVATRATLP